MQSVVKRSQVRIHLLLQISRQKPQSLPRLHGRSGQDQSLHLALREHPHRQDRGQEGLTRSRRSQSEGEVMPLHGIDVMLLTQRPRPQHRAGLTARQHLLSHRRMVILPTTAEGAKGRLEINAGHGLSVLPDRTHQLNHRCSPLDLRWPSGDHQLETPQHQRGSGQSFKAMQGRFGSSSESQSCLRIR